MSALSELLAAWALRKLSALRDPRLGEWARSPRNRGTVTLLIVAIPIASLSYGLHVVDQNARDRSDSKFEQLLAGQQESNREGLIIIRKAALAECARANVLQLDLRQAHFALNRFGDTLAQFLETAAKARSSSAHDPKLTPAQRRLNASAVVIYDGLRETVPRNLNVPPAPRPCQDVVPSIAELRSQAPPAG